METPLRLPCRTGPRGTPAHPPAELDHLGRAVARRSYSDRSYRVFTTARRVRFVESEYAIPAETAPAVLAELRREVPSWPTR